MKKKDYLSPKTKVLTLSMQTYLTTGSPIEQGEDDEPADSRGFSGLWGGED